MFDCHLDVGQIVVGTTGKSYRVISKFHGPNEFKIRLAGISAKLAFNKDFDLYVSSYIEKWNQDNPDKPSLPYPIGPDGKPFRWAKWLQHEIAPKINAGTENFADAAAVRDEAIHEMLFTVLGQRRILDEFASSMKNFVSEAQAEPIAKQLTIYLCRNFKYRVSEMNKKLKPKTLGHEDEQYLEYLQDRLRQFPPLPRGEPGAKDRARERRKIEKKIKEVEAQLGGMGDFKDTPREMSMWVPDKTDTDATKERNILEQEQYGVGEDEFQTAEAQKDVAKFSEGFGAWLRQTQGQKVGGSFLALFDIYWDLVSRSGKSRAKEDVEKSERTKQREKTEPWMLQRGDLEEMWKERTGLSLGSLIEYLDRLPGLMERYITIHAEELGESNIFVDLMDRIRKQRGKARPAKASSLNLAGVEEDFSEARAEAVSPDTADKDIRQPTVDAKQADEAPDDGPDYYDFPKNWKEEETEETHDKKKETAAKTARLLRGDQLTPDMVKQVKDAFIKRWTRDNPHRAKVYNCDKCDVANNPFFGPRSQGHPHPTIPLVSDEEWLREYAFSFTNAGKLQPNRHAQPAYLGEEPNEMFASVAHRFAAEKAAKTQGQLPCCGGWHNMHKPGCPVYEANFNRTIDMLASLPEKESMLGHDFNDADGQAIRNETLSDTGRIPHDFNGPDMNRTARGLLPKGFCEECEQKPCICGEDDNGEPKEAADEGQEVSVARTILEQLGGGKFIAMTGAKNLVDHGNGLSFRLPGGGGFTKSGINSVRIDLEPSDTYKVTFSRIRAGKVLVVAEHGDIYADSLREVFERETGLATSLGRTGADKSAAEVPTDNWQCIDCGHEGMLRTDGTCEACGSAAVGPMAPKETQPRQGIGKERLVPDWKTRFQEPEHVAEASEATRYGQTFYPEEAGREHPEGCTCPDDSGSCPWCAVYYGGIEKDAAGSNSGNDDPRGAGDLWHEEFYEKQQGIPPKAMMDGMKKDAQGSGNTTVTMQEQNVTDPAAPGRGQPMAVPEAIDQQPGPHSPNAPSTAPRSPSIQPRIVNVPPGTIGEEGMARQGSEDANAWESEDEGLNDIIGDTLDKARQEMEEEGIGLEEFDCPRCGSENTEVDEKEDGGYDLWCDNCDAVVDTWSPSEAYRQVQKPAQRPAQEQSHPNPRYTEDENRQFEDFMKGIGASRKFSSPEALRIVASRLWEAKKAAYYPEQDEPMDEEWLNERGLHEIDPNLERKKEREDEHLYGGGRIQDKKPAKRRVKNAAGQFIDDEWRQILEANGFYPRPMHNDMEVWANARTGTDIVIDVDDYTEEPFWIQMRNGKAQGTGSVDSGELKQLVEQPAEPQGQDDGNYTEDENRQFAEFMKGIGASKKFASPDALEIVARRLWDKIGASAAPAAAPVLPNVVQQQNARPALAPAAGPGGAMMAIMPGPQEEGAPSKHTVEPELENAKYHMSGSAKTAGEPKVVAENVYPPIPIRDFDWTAYDDNTYDGAPDSGRQAVGWGRTEEEAVADFWEQWNELHDSGPQPAQAPMENI